MAKVYSIPEEIAEQATIVRSADERSRAGGSRPRLLQRAGTRPGQPALRAVVWRRLLLGVEFLAILLWTVAFARPYLDMDPSVMPTGREFGSAIQVHHLWMQMRECGWCALWYGNAGGGFPSFAEPTGSQLHPLVIAATLTWGVLNGAKVALAAAFLMAGLAQWWLAYELGVGRIARIWSAGMAVVAGNLSARMELGGFSLLMSTATCTLVLPSLVAFARSGRRRSAILLGVALALLAVAGDGYLQVAMAFSLPLALLLIQWKLEWVMLLARRSVLVAVLALLLAAPFLVPFLHFLPEFAKDHDPSFKTAQPFQYLPLNLVISDLQYYTSDALRKLPYPSHYGNYVGWIPVLLAFWALRGGRDTKDRRVIAFLAGFVFLPLWLGSAVPQA